jgi:hypothetical protein
MMDKDFFIIDSEPPSPWEFEAYQLLPGSGVPPTHAPEQPVLAFRQDRGLPFRMA